jgi:flagellar biosynthesis protein FlhG
MSYKKPQEKELSLEEILAECPGAIKGTFAFSAKDKEKELSLEEIFAECPDGADAATKLSGQNKEQFQQDESLEDPQDAEASSEETFSESPDEMDDDPRLTCENKEQFHVVMSSEKHLEKELSLEEIFAGCPDEIKETALILDKNKEQLDEIASSEDVEDKEEAAAENFSDSANGLEDASLPSEKNQEPLSKIESSEKFQDKDLSTEESSFDSIVEKEDASLISHENQDHLQETASSAELQDKQKAPLETSFASFCEQERKPVETFLPKLDSPLMQSAKEALPIIPIPFRVRNAENSKIGPDASSIRKSSQKMIAVGGAKGGVGKSMLSANLAVGLSLLGQKVVLADLDLGGADIHLYTGVKSLTKTWKDFLDKKVDSIQDILTPTAFEGLSLIGGDSSRLGSANLPYFRKLKMIRHLKALETDFLIIDLGGDTSYNGLDFFLQADQKIVVSGTEPASVLDSYTFVKVANMRLLERFFARHKRLKDLAEQVKDGSLEKSKNYSLDFIFQQVRTRDPQALFELKMQLEQFCLSIVLNMTESSKDMQIAESMQNLVKDKCFLDIGILGTIPLDGVVHRAAREFTPIVVEHPTCQASRSIYRMLAAIILSREQEATRTELLHHTSQIRREVKKQIDSGTMTLDGLTSQQINALFNTTPRRRPSFQKILNVMLA